MTGPVGVTLTEGVVGDEGDGEGVTDGVGDGVDDRGAVPTPDS